MRLGSLLGPARSRRMTQGMGNPKMQQVCAVTQLPEEMAQWMAQGTGQELQRAQVVAGDALPRTVCLGLAKGDKVGLVLFPRAWGGSQLLACGPSDTLMSLWDTGVSLLDEPLSAVMSIGLPMCCCKRGLNLGVMELRTDPSPTPPPLSGKAGNCG